MKTFAQHLVERKELEHSQLLEEMPYVNISDDNPNKLFDFEFEKYPTIGTFLTRLKQLFDGKVHIDKYQNEIGPALTASDRKEIIDNVLADKLHMVYAVAMNKWKLDKEEFALYLNVFLDNFNELVRIEGQAEENTES